MLLYVQQENVGAIYATAVAYTVVKQAPKARAQLKRVMKSPWNMDVRFRHPPSTFGSRFSFVVFVQHNGIFKTVLSIDAV